MWLLGLLNGVLTGVVCSFEELWAGIFFCLIPFSGILLTGRKTSGFIAGYGMGYYVTGLCFLYKLVGVVPFPFYTACALLTVAILGLSAWLTFLLWLALMPFQRWRRGGGWDIFLLAGLYTLGEWLQGAIPALAFPWFRLSVAAVQIPVLIQGASLFGSLFVSFLIILWNTLMARLLLKRRMEAGSCLAAVLLVGMLLYGEMRLYRMGPGTCRVLVVQGNHQGIAKWSMTSEDIFDDYVRLIESYEGEAVSLVLLPETALPYAVSMNEESRERLTALAKELSADILLGSLEQEETKERLLLYNAVCLVTEEGLSESVYRKQILVPFGEYLPFSRGLRRFYPEFISYLEDSYMNGNYFEPGEGQVIFETRAGRAGALICYESIFPEAAEQAVREGAELLVIVSNDSWFQNTPAMRQHHAHAILRAVEQDRYVIRAGNTGISSVIDNRGRIVAGIEENRQGALQAEAASRRSRTVYAVIGELFPAILAGFYLLSWFRQVCILIFYKFSSIIERIRSE